MTVAFQVTFDAHEPERLARFWIEVLGYVVQPPPPGFDTWDEFLDSIDWPKDERDARFALVDPEGTRPRFLFQKVSEPKTAKNHMHLDVNVGTGAKNSEERRAVVRSKADALLALGATEVNEAEEAGEYWIVMQDIEGNEFCLQ